MLVVLSEDEEQEVVVVVLIVQPVQLKKKAKNISKRPKLMFTLCLAYVTSEHRVKFDQVLMKKKKKERRALL